MFDFIKTETAIRDFPKWREKVNNELFNGIDTFTGVIDEKIRGNTVNKFHYGKYKEYKLLVIEKQTGSKTSYRLIIKGSIHKNIEGGTNYRPISFIQVVSEINDLCTHLHINANETRFRNLEIGIPIKFPVPVYPYLKRNLLFMGAYKERTDFTPSNYNVKIGFMFCITGYKFKIYDTALKHNLSGQNIMRVETHFNVMRDLKSKGIVCLADITKIEKVRPLIKFLIKKWDMVVLDDNSIQKSILNKKELKVLEYCAPRDYLDIFKEMNPHTAASRVKRYRSVISKYGNNYHKLIKKSLSESWNQSVKLH